MPNEIAVFISHTSSDTTLARALVDLLEKAFKISARQIRCTSVNGYRLPVGADTAEQLRHEIFGARAFVAVLTPASWGSTYVLFELGARWGAKRHLAPVLARGTNSADLRDPLSSLNALLITDRAQVLQFVEDLAEYLRITLEPMSSFEREIDLVVDEAQESLPPPEPRKRSNSWA